MPELKLSRLPDRTPVKISISVAPDLHAQLAAYADAYQAAYGSAESVAELIPYMLTAFVESDSGFKKAKRDRAAAPDGNGRNAPKSRRGLPIAGSASLSTVPNDSN